MRISELSRRSGFSPSTLRYYETVGLLPDPDRTDAGYRVYGDDAVERLAFVARAKGLGLSLTEVAELVELWADGPCAPTRERLVALLEAKIGEVRGRLGQLSTLAVQLEHLLRSLAAPDSQPADRCGPGCGCDAALPPPVPVGCTLSAAAATDRTAEWADLVAHATELTATPGGIRLRLPADPTIVARTAELAVLEVGCCAFFTFALTVDAAGVWLDVSGPADARPLLEA
ncbi:MAG TPA: MerR family transcriptional regulator, partial [Acidimicrobiales bacterium]